MLVSTKMHIYKCPQCEELGYECELCCTEPPVKPSIGQLIYMTPDGTLNTSQNKDSIRVGMIWSILEESCVVKLEEPLPEILTEIIKEAESKYAVK